MSEIKKCKECGKVLNERGRPNKSGYCSHCHYQEWQKSNIKSKNIKHLVITNGQDIDVYICNQACGITKEKSTWDKKEVTCKNCLQIIKVQTYRKLRKFKLEQEG